MNHEGVCRTAPATPGLLIKEAHNVQAQGRPEKNGKRRKRR